MSKPPQKVAPGHRPSATRCLLLGFGVAWMAAILLGPVLDSPGIYAFFAPICHQQGDRSWLLAGHPLPVCIRCTAIYSGLFVGICLGARPNVAFLRSSLVATGLQMAAAVSGVDSQVFRALTGFLLGLAAAGFVARGVAELLADRLAFSGTRSGFFSEEVS